MKRYNSMQTFAVLIAATAMLVAGCTRSELTPDDKPIIPDGMGELTIGQLLLLGNETDPQASAQTRADVATNLPQGATLRLYAFTEGETDFNSTLATRTYTISANGTAQLDAGQNPLFLPAGKADIYLVGPIRHNAGTVSDPNMVDIAAEWGITPHIGADLIATYTSATITAGNSNPLSAMILEHKMALAQVVVETNPAAVYENLVVKEIILYAQPTTGTFTLDQTGGAITTDNQQVTNYTYPSLSKDPTEEKYSGTTVLLPQAEREMKIETSFECNQKNTEAGDAHPTLKYRQSGLVTLPLAAGTATRLTTAPITPVEIKWRAKVLPWNDLLGEDFVIAGPDIEVPYVEIDGLKWATGNLVAYGANDCRVGAPGDHGLYFQFGGLIGYKGGANGTGTGITTQSGGTFWGGASVYSANDVAVAPTGYANQGSWPQHENKSSGGFGYYYFNTLDTQYKDFQAEDNALDPDNGIGDPCAYYLGGEWRLPKYGELSAITGRTDETWIAWSTADLTSKWTTTGPQSTIGAWFGPSAKTNPTASTDLFIPASGFRRNSNGSLNNAGIEGFIWSSSVRHATMGYGSYIHGSKGVVPHQGHLRTYGLPVRCVSGTLLIHEPTPPTADQTIEIDGLKWTTGNLVATDAANCKVGAPGDGGLYFQFGSLIGWKGGSSGDGTGRPAKANGAFYGGGAFNAADEVQVMPAPFKQIDVIGTTWPDKTINRYYFGLSSYSTNGANIQDYEGVLDGTMADEGVGDPCRYYLGDTWRMPTYEETKAMTDAAVKTWPGTWKNSTSTDSYLVCTFSGVGELKFPAVGYRDYSRGSINGVGDNAFYWSSSVQNFGNGYTLNFSDNNFDPQGYNNRSRGYSIRCVSGTYVPPPTHEPTPPTQDQIVEINGLKWAKGNLVAKDAVNAKVGKPEDGGLYFQFGSLIGWKGGANGDGTGRPTKADNTYYVGNSFNAADEVQVKPVPFKQIDAIRTTWPERTDNLYYFGLSSYSTNGANFQESPGVLDGSMADKGVGDPCRYYLGDTWRMPTSDEIALTHNAASKTYPGSWTNATSTNSYFVCKFTNGTELKFPAVGRRAYSKGSIDKVGNNGYYWSSSVFGSGSGYALFISSGSVNEQGINSRSFGMPVRCVSGTYVPPAPPHKPTPPTPDQILEIDGLKWTKGNLVATDASNAKVGAPGDGGLYFQYGGLIGYKGGANGDGIGITNATTHADNKYWGGAAAYSADDVAVKPVAYANQGTWPYHENKESGGFGYYYFSNFTKKYDDFQAQVGANNPADGIGDPCAYYLGSPWRLPKYDELSSITGNTTEGAWVRWEATSVTGKWDRSGPQSTMGAWFGPNSRSGTPTVNTDLFIPASGYRLNSNGVFNFVGINGYLWSSSASSAIDGYYLVIHMSSGVIPRNGHNRARAFPVRCVNGSPIPTVEIAGTKWAMGNLVADGANGAKIGEPGDGGLYFQYGGLIGYKGGANGTGTGITSTTLNDKWWGGTLIYSANDIAVKPATYLTIVTWPDHEGKTAGGFGYYYFNTFDEKYANFQSQGNANDPSLGIGDPCTYYLGNGWRLPTYTELAAITGSSTEEAYIKWDVAGVTGRWEKTDGPKSAIGAWFGPNSHSGGSPTVNTDLFVPASGNRNGADGKLIFIDEYGSLQSSSTFNGTGRFYLDFGGSFGVAPAHPIKRIDAMPVRCVRN